MDLIIALKDSDEEAYRQVFILYRGKVLNYFIKKTGSVHDAEDLLQNTFLRLWKYRTSLSEEYLLEQHLFNMARSVFIDYTRGQNNLKKAQAVIKTAMAEAAREKQTGEKDLEDLEKILRNLPEMRRKIFIMHKLDGYSYREIAEILSITIKSVDNHISRASRKIKRALMSFLF